MRRASFLVIALLAAGITAAGCAEEGVLGSSHELTTLRRAAELGEARFGVPASLTLAVGYTETRWQLPEEDAHEDHDHHMPSMVGVGGLRPWLESDPVGTAADALGVAPEALHDDPALSLLGTAAVLRAMAEARGDVPASDDPGAWGEVLGDYAGLDHESARESYRTEVLGWISRGVAGTGPLGEEIVLHARDVRIPESVGVSREYSGAEYPGARWVPSGNYNSRGGTRIDRIVIHTTQGNYSGAISWLANPSSQVSAHYVIRSSDGEITQMVSEANRAWHVGNTNSRSIGIEHEGWINDPGRWYTDAMYRASAALTRHLCQKYGIPMDRTHIIGHVEAPGATHTDPGNGWDWARYMDLVRGVPAGPPYDATYAAKDFPSEMTSGDRVVAWIEMNNTGSSTWSLTDTQIATAAPSPLYDVENWTTDTQASGADHSTYDHGSVGRFTFMITAPEVSADTTITETFQLHQAGTGFFGEEVTVSLLVRPRAGAAPVDADGDGSPADVDCDDADASRHPGATDVCGDGIDSDCDGVDPVCGSDAGVSLPGDGGVPVDPMDPGAPTDPTDPGVMGADRVMLGGCSVGQGPDAAGLGLLFAALALLVLRRRA